MRHPPFRPWFCRGVLLAAVLLAPSASSLQAQDDKAPKIHLPYFSYDDKLASSALPKDAEELKLVGAENGGAPVALRPNLTQPLTLLLVEKENDTPIQNVTVTLVQVQNDVRTDIATAVVKSSPKKSAQVIKGWTSTKPVAPPAAPPAAAVPAAPVPLLEVKTHPFEFEVRVEYDNDMQKKESWSYSLQVRIMKPGAYIENESVQPEKDFLMVKVKGTDGLRGPPCPLELDLSRVNFTAPGVTTGEVNRSSSAALLLNLKKQKFTTPTADPKTPPKIEGSIAITADGCRGAIIYNYSAAGAGTWSVDRTLQLHLSGVPDSLPAGDKLHVRIEVDNEDTKAKKKLLTVALVSSDDKDVVPFSRDFTEARVHRLRLLPPATDGVLLLQTELTEHVVDIDTRGLSGKFKVLATWRQTDKNELPKEPNVSTELPVTLATVPYDVTLSRFELKLPKDAKEGTKPEEVEADKPAPPGGTVELKAKALTSDAEVKDVVFFVGRPTPDHKVPPTARVIRVSDIKTVPWKAKLTLPPDARDEVEVSVLVTNTSGLSADRTITVKIADDKDKEDPSKKKLKNQTIVVKVVEGDRPQNDLPVALRDGATGAVKATAKTKEGVATFEDVAPGKYKVYTVSEASNTKSAAAVEVKGDEKEKITLELKLYRGPLPKLD